MCNGCHAFWKYCINFAFTGSVYNCYTVYAYVPKLLFWKVVTQKVTTFQAICADSLSLSPFHGNMSGKFLFMEGCSWLWFSYKHLFMLWLLHDGGKELGDSMEQMQSGGWMQLLERPWACSCLLSFCEIWVQPEWNILFCFRIALPWILHFMLLCGWLSVPYREVVICSQLKYLMLFWQKVSGSTTKLFLL